MLSRVTSSMCNFNTQFHPGLMAMSVDLHLRGALDGDQLKGTWDDTTNRGEWSGTRLE